MGSSKTPKDKESYGRMESPDWESGHLGTSPNSTPNLLWDLSPVITLSGFHTDQQYFMIPAIANILSI